MKALFYQLILSLSIISSVSAAEDASIVVSGHPEYPPFMWQENQQIVGAGPDIARAIFQKLGIKVESPYMGSWGRVLQQAKSGKIDFLVGGFKNPQRETYLDFTDIPYIEDPVVLYVRKDHQFEFNQWQDLINKKGATGIGESFGQDFDQFEKQHLTLTKVSNIAQAMRMLDRGRVDYVICGYYSGWANILKLNIKHKIEKLERSVVTPVAYQAFSKLSPFNKYLKAYNQQFKILQQQGEIQRIINKNMRQWEQKNQQP